MALLSQLFRTAAITGQTEAVNAWFADRQGGRWAEQTVRAALPELRPGGPESLRELMRLRERGVITEEELDVLRKRLRV